MLTLKEEDEIEYHDDLMSSVYRSRTCYEAGALTAATTRSQSSHQRLTRDTLRANNLKVTAIKGRTRKTLKTAFIKGARSPSMINAGPSNAMTSGAQDETCNRIGQLSPLRGIVVLVHTGIKGRTSSMPHVREENHITSPPSLQIFSASCRSASLTSNDQPNGAAALHSRCSSY